MSDKYFKERKYLSDSVQNWREGCFCKNFRNYKRMQILTHPIWWTADGKNREEIIKTLLGGELDYYKKWVDSLSNKYKKYIGEVNSQTRAKVKW